MRHEPTINRRGQAPLVAPRLAASLTPRLAPGLALAAAVLLFSGCGVLNEQNQYVSQWLDDSIQPKSTTARLALAPLALPAGLVGYGLDNFLIHPVVQLRDSWFFTSEVLWDGMSITDFGDAALVPVRIVFTPVVYVLVWATRSLTAVDRYNVGSTDPLGHDLPPPPPRRIAPLPR